ncbi:transforming growth factor beta-1-induced transcript 1 protein-like isoform X3 [Strigops habroptila]|uniref:transforming growth factor beta-1-induced transcript 1 protein-like isoform X3 n=1 Tax=Strigops habroptila TaxID=2489341 RepID=UPI0011CFE99D|nr:transforming growth factor beta-1-induced transcript 1 protein-like isoform X3 [Strigops habroptila]
MGPSDALLADLETTTSHLSLEPPPHGKVPEGDKEQLYSMVQKPRPPPPGLGELDRLLRDLNATHSSIADELLARFPPSLPPEELKKTPPDATKDGAAPPGRSGPPQVTPSSATQELDKLMASLSHFHLQHQSPPSKEVPQEENLDSMLVALQKDLGRQGVPMGNKGVCGGCLKPIAGKALLALGRWWHPRHFRCAACGQTLAGSGFFERDGAPYCPEDYGRLFAPACAGCARPILHQMVTALDKTWHPEHFCCTHCGGVLGEQGFVAREQRPYCPRDYGQLFGSRCRGCSSPILAGFISALQGLWHPQCFVCAECSAPITGGTFFEADGRPVCERHSQPRSQPLSQRSCTFCLQPFRGAAPQQRDGKLYCQLCAQHLLQ